MEQADSLGEETIKTQVTRLPTTHIIKRTVMVKRTKQKQTNRVRDTIVLRRGALGHIKPQNLRKNYPKPKNRKNFDQNRKLHAKLSETDTFSPGWYPSY